MLKKLLETNLAPLNSCFKDEDRYITILKEKGFVVIKSVFDWQKLKENSFIAERLRASSTSGSFYYSLLNNPQEININLSLLISQYFKQSLHFLFPNYRYFAGSFLVKPPHDCSELFLHQDWNNTDEKQFMSITAWTPLIDTNEMSGGMFFLNGSHLYFDNIRSNSYETARFSLAEIGKENITPVTVCQGDILLFNPAVWHGSFPNKLSFPRQVFTCVLLPKNAPFCYFHKLSKETALRYNIPDDMPEKHLSDIINGKQIDTLFSDGISINYSANKINVEDLIRQFKRYNNKDIT